MEHIFPDQTLAAYYSYGIETGLLADEQAKVWAFRMISERSEPSYEIIEIACAKNRRLLLDWLTQAQGQRQSNASDAGRCLLTNILVKLRTDPDYDVRDALSQAVKIAKAAQMPENIYDMLSLIDDSLFLLEDCGYGTMKEISRDLQDILENEGRRLPDNSLS